VNIDALLLLFTFVFIVECRHLVLLLSFKLVIPLFK